MKTPSKLASLLLISSLHLAACAPQGSSFTPIRSGATASGDDQGTAVDTVKSIAPSVSAPQAKTSLPTAGGTTGSSTSAATTANAIAATGATANAASEASAVAASTADTAPSGQAKTVATESGMMRPTIYYVPVFNTQSCSTDKMKALHGLRGETLMDVCPDVLAQCALEGSCAVKDNGRLRHFNISTEVKGEDRFFESTGDNCPYGYGVASACLDPFYTVAADLNLYKAGDVIYIPAAVGLELPNGSKHTGFFVVRDKGRGVSGKGRFDFFSGFVSWKSPENPFVKMGFSDLSTHIPYYKISGEKAEQTLESRAFPRLPQ